MKIRICRTKKLTKSVSSQKGTALVFRKEDLFEYCIKVRLSISPTSTDTSLKTKNSKRDISINKNIYDLLYQIIVKENCYLFDSNEHSEGINNKIKRISFGYRNFTNFRNRILLWFNN